MWTKTLSEILLSSLFPELQRSLIFDSEVLLCGLLLASLEFAVDSDISHASPVSVEKTPCQGLQKHYFMSCLAFSRLS